MNLHRKLIVAAAVCLGIYQADAMAACTSTSCNSKVRSIYTFQRDGAPTVAIRVAESVEEISKLKTSCEPGEASYIVLSSTHPAYKEFYSNLLAAGASKATLNLRVSHTPGAPCQLSYIVYTF
jgi:hypothetical protein